VSSDPRAVIGVIELSRAGYRKMLQNLAWAAGYNIIAMPLAAGVLAPVGDRPGDGGRRRPDGASRRSWWRSTPSSYDATAIGPHCAPDIGALGFRFVLGTYARLRHSTGPGAGSPRCARA
jgi:hypothetical protein